MAEALDDERGPLDAGDIARHLRDLYLSYVAALYRRQGWRVEPSGAADGPEFALCLKAWGMGESEGPPTILIRCVDGSSAVDEADVDRLGAARSLIRARHAVIAVDGPLTPAARERAASLGISVRRINAETWQQGADVTLSEASSAHAEAAATSDAGAIAVHLPSRSAVRATRRRPSRLLSWLVLSPFLVFLFLGGMYLHQLLAPGLPVGTRAAGTSAASGASPAVLPPASPVGLKAVDGSASVALSWTPSAGATGYTVWREQSGAITEVGTTSGPSFTDASVSPGTAYSYWVTAQDAGTSSSPSQKTGVTTYLPWSQIHSAYADSIVEVSHCDGVFCLSETGGTGWFAPGGYIVTNYHVVMNATYYIDVTLQNNGTGSGYAGQVLHAHVMAIDQTDDLALMKLDNGFAGTPLPLGHSASLRVGQPVAVLGHPGLEQLTMTTGNIEGLGQTGQIQGYGTVPNMIVYDAGVVGGSSGSPVLDHWGNVVGIEEAAGTNNGNYDLAVPVSALRALLQQNGVNIGP